MAKRYPWESWLTGEEVTLTRDEYLGSPRNFASNLRYHARKFKTTVSIDSDEAGTIRFTFAVPEPDAPESTSQEPEVV